MTSRPARRCLHRVSVNKKNKKKKKQWQDSIKPVNFQKEDAELQSLEAARILSKVEWSDWAMPIVPVIKKGKPEAVCICKDFKVSIDPVLCTVQYPLPCIDDISMSLAGGQNFSKKKKKDLMQAYLQMKLKESSKKFLTINTHRGLFQYNKLVFGLVSAPAIWQKVLYAIPGTQCYLDDITVMGRNDEELFRTSAKCSTS